MNVTLATTPPDLDLIAARWDAMAVTSPHAARQLFTLVQRVSSGTTRPHVMLIEDEGREPILVVGRVECRPLRIKAGYRTLLAPEAQWLVVVAGGVVGARTPSDVDRVLTSLRDALRRGDADILQLSKLDTNGYLRRAALQDMPWHRRGHGQAPQKHHRSDLSRGFDAFLAGRSKGTRWRIRRRLRKLEEADVKMAVRRIGPYDDVNEATRLVDQIASTSYQRGIGVGFVDDELHRELMTWAIADGPFRVWTLSVDGHPVAYLNGLLHDGTFFLFETGFDPLLSDDEPGAILMARVLQELAEEPGVDAFDYGFGDAQYKQSLSDQCWDEVDILEFAARPRAMCLSFVSGAVTLSVSMAKRILGDERVAALRRLKRAEMARAGAGRAEHG